jgi:hypothetical protein
MSMERLGRPTGIQGLHGRIATMGRPDAMRGRTHFSYGYYIPYWFNGLRLQLYCNRIERSCNPWITRSLESLKG